MGVHFALAAVGRAESMFPQPSSYTDSVYIGSAGYLKTRATAPHVDEFDEA